MNYLNYKKGWCFLGIILLLSSCVNLKHVNDFSSSSLNSIRKFEEINYGFHQNCMENCFEMKMGELNFTSTDCNCSLNEKADSINLLIYNTIKGYLIGLSNLSNNDLTSYKINPLSNALMEHNSNLLTLEKSQVDAYTTISTILLKSFTDEFRKKKIKEYVITANEPLKILINYLDFNLSANLIGKLDIQRQRIQSYYFDLLQDKTLSSHEKRNIIGEYYQQIIQLENRKSVLLSYSKILKKINIGHQKLVDAFNTLSKEEIKAQFTQYSSDMEDIISEFNKIKKDK